MLRNALFINAACWVLPDSKDMLLDSRSLWQDSMAGEICFHEILVHWRRLESELLWYADKHGLDRLQPAAKRRQGVLRHTVVIECGRALASISSGWGVCSSLSNSRSQLTLK